MEIRNSQIRLDPITKEWVIYATQRAGRPHDSSRQRTRPPLNPYEAACPFCPGNESILQTPVLCEVQATDPSGSLWSVRVVENKYPALRNDVAPKRIRKGLCISMDGYGRQEVIIEHARHDVDLPVYTPQEMGAVIEAYQLRYNELLRDPKVAMVSVFRNHGPWAGTSLLHPHSQVIAAPTVTRSVRQREEAAQHYFDEMGSCVFCDLVESELASGERLVAHSVNFVAFVPYAARVPFETVVVPSRHTADFGTISPEERQDLGLVLLSVIGRLAAKLNKPDYNLIVHSYTRYKAEEPHLHWYVQILPRTLTRAGFEMGTGFSINPSFPEEDAAVLGCVDLRKEVVGPDPVSY